MEDVGVVEGEATFNPVFRVRDMGAVLHEPVHVRPDDLLETALTCMLTRDFSQLPVYSSPRDLKGVVSWRTIGTRKVLAGSRELIKDFMEPATTIDMDRPVLEAVDLVAANDYVVVVEHREVKAILTASDFSLQFKTLSAPFLLIGEIEHGLRGLLDGNFDLGDLGRCQSPADHTGAIDASDLTFGEYVRLLQKPGVWSRLGLALDCKVFTERLDDIRRIRNKVMHFRPDGIEDAEIERLEAFARFMRRLREIPPEL